MIHIDWDNGWVQNSVFLLIDIALLSMVLPLFLENMQKKKWLPMRTSMIAALVNGTIGLRQEVFSAFSLFNGLAQNIEYSEKSVLYGTSASGIADPTIYPDTNAVIARFIAHFDRADTHFREIYSAIDIAGPSIEPAVSGHLAEILSTLRAIIDTARNVWGTMLDYVELSAQAHGGYEVISSRSYASDIAFYSDVEEPLIEMLEAMNRVSAEIDAAIAKSSLLGTRKKQSDFRDLKSDYRMRQIDAMLKSAFSKDKKPFKKETMKQMQRPTMGDYCYPDREELYAVVNTLRSTVSVEAGQDFSVSR